MALLVGDDFELLAHLHEGWRQTPPWNGFLQHLKRRCQADEAAILFCMGEADLARMASWTASQDPTALDHSLGERLLSLRTSRVYALEELTPPNGAPDWRRYGRVMRLADDGQWTTWIVLLRQVGDLSATAGALLSALAPQIALAMRNFTAMETLRFHAAATDALLARAGIAWRAYKPAPDADHRTPNSTEFDEAFQKAAGEATQTAAAVLARPQQANGPSDAILALPAPAAGLFAPPASNVLRVERVAPKPTAAQLRCLREQWSLSENEARLALALAEGTTLHEAANLLDLSPQTVRNYSKRIYSKTGTRGLPDLVRLVLTSVTSLA